MILNHTYISYRSLNFKDLEGSTFLKSALKNILNTKNWFPTFCLQCITSFTSLVVHTREIIMFHLNGTITFEFHRVPPSVCTGIKVHAMLNWFLFSIAAHTCAFSNERTFLLRTRSNIYVKTTFSISIIFLFFLLYHTFISTEELILKILNHKTF